MKPLILSIVFLLSISKIEAQNTNSGNDTSSPKITLDEVIVSANNFTEHKKNVAQSVDVITAAQIAAANTQNTGDLLINTGKVFVQKSQQGGSSPVLRGFEASRILIVLDGVRLNNAIYRSGHLQNIITTDQNMLQQAEVLYGPCSTIYGSDALGGAIHLITKKPVLSTTGKLITTGSSFARYSTVNNEKTLHADISVGGPKFAWLQSYTFSDFGDMKMGANYSGKYPGFGRRDSFVQTINNADQVVANNNSLVQKFSGYKQWDITQKMMLKQSDRVTHLLNVQFSNSSNIPRYDRLQDTRNGTLRYAEWFYGPQKRLLTAYELNIKRVWLFDDFKVNINYQDIEESRQTRDYRRYDRFDSRIENVKVWGATISGRKVTGNHEITTGIDMQLNDVKSTAFRRNILTGAETKLDTRYPDGKNKMNNYALFAQHLYKFTNQKLVLNDGLRLQAVHLNSNVADNSFFRLPDTAVTQNNFAVTGNIGLVYTANKSTVIRGTISSGFRTPNFEDLKIFESATSAKQVVIPNANIKPEYTYNADIALQQKLSEKIVVEFSAFYTLFRNAIIKAPSTLNGQDSIVYNGTKSQVLSSQNAAKANLNGFTLSLDASITKQLSFSSTVTYTYGRFKTDDSKPSAVYIKQPNGTYQQANKNVSSLPLDHIPPVIGKTSLNWRGKILNTHLAVLYNSAKRLDQMNAVGEDNAQYGTSDGFPGWAVFNWKASVNVSKTLQVQAGIENILDRNYRYFASGFSAGGRNFYIAARINW